MNADRDARLKTAETNAARLAEDLRKAEVVQAQLQAELEEAQRERRGLS